MVLISTPPVPDLATRYTFKALKCHKEKNQSCIFYFKVNSQKNEKKSSLVGNVGRCYLTSSQHYVSMARHT